jgi:hypothetical protein
MYPTPMYTASWCNYKVLKNVKEEKTSPFMALSGRQGFERIPEVLKFMVK